MRFHSGKRQRSYGAPVAEHVPRCARCGRAEDATSNLTQGAERVLLTSYVCGHRFCEDCRERYLVGKFPCPGYPPAAPCGKMLTRSDLVAKDYLDILAEKDVKNRREVMAVFNKFVEDFGGDEAAFNAYLEEAETLVYNLSNGVDVPQTKERLAAQQRIDAERIRKNKLRRNQQAEEELNRIRDEQDERERRERRAVVEAEEVRDAEAAYQKQWHEFRMGQRTSVTVKSGDQVRAEHHQRHLAEAAGANLEAGLHDGTEGHVTSMASMWLNPDYKPDIRTSTVIEFQDVVRRRKQRGNDKLMRQLGAEAAGYRRGTLNQVRRLEAMTGLAALLGEDASLRIASKLRLQKVRKVTR